MKRKRVAAKRAAGRKAGKAGAEAAERRTSPSVSGKGRCGDRELIERMREEHFALHPGRSRRELCGFARRKAPPVAFTGEVVIEYRCGSGVRVGRGERRAHLRHLAGAIVQTGGFCDPRQRRKLAEFYGNVDHDIEVWWQREELKLRVPYMLRAKRHRDGHLAIVRADAVRRGAV